jgi:type II secretory pathway pseudopilin PulG
MKQRGFSLLEALLAVALVATVVMGLLPAFIVCKDVNSHNAVRTGAVAAAQRVLESHRRTPPDTMPSSGSSAIQTITVGERDYEVVTHFCDAPAWCDNQTRHLVVEVDYGNETVLRAETVFTKLR